MDKEVFSPFFQKFELNRINLGRSGTSCEACENAWLMKNGFINRVELFHDCSRVQSDPHYFDKCKQ